jgi:uncharacterized membrane protein
MVDVFIALLDNAMSNYEQSHKDMKDRMTFALELQEIVDVIADSVLEETDITTGIIRES